MVAPLAKASTARTAPHGTFESTLDPARGLAARSSARPLTHGLPRLLPGRTCGRSAGASGSRALAGFRVGDAVDPLERAADRAADAALADSPGPTSAEARAREAESGTVRREAVAPSQDAMRRSPGGHAPGEAVGTPLSTDLRTYFEPRFGHDFSRVRIHHDADAAATARGIDARAFTLGSDIGFAAGEYAPGTAAGRRLIAHELAHVVQQRSSDAAIIRRQPRGSPALSNEDRRREAIAAASEWFYESEAADPTAIANHARQLQADLAAPDISPTEQVATARRLLALVDVLHRRERQARRDVDGTLLYEPPLGAPEPWSPDRPRQVEDLAPFDPATVAEWRQIASGQPVGPAPQVVPSVPGHGAPPPSRQLPGGAVAVTFQKQEGMTFSTPEGQQRIMLAVVAATRSGYSMDQLAWAVQALGTPRWAAPGSTTLPDWQSKFEALAAGDSFTIVQYASFISQVDDVLGHAPSQRDFMLEGYRQGVLDARSGLYLGIGTFGLGVVALSGGALVGSLGAVSMSLGTGSLVAGEATPLLTGGLAGRAAIYGYLNAPAIFADVTLGAAAVTAGISAGERVREIRGRPGGLRLSDVGGFAQDAAGLLYAYGESMQLRSPVGGGASEPESGVEPPQPLTRPLLTGWRARALQAVMVGTLRSTPAVQGTGAGPSRPVPALIGGEEPSEPAVGPVLSEASRPQAPAPTPAAPAADVGGSRDPAYWQSTRPASGNPAQPLPLGTRPVSDLAERRAQDAQAAEAVRQQAMAAAQRPPMMAVAGGGPQTGGAPISASRPNVPGPRVTVVPPGVSGLKPPTPSRLAPSNVTARPTGERSARDTDILEQPGMREQRQAYPGAEQHHVFPQAFRDWFAARFAAHHDIDEYTVFLDWGAHNAIHTRAEGGIRQGAKEPDLVGWNEEWRAWIDSHPHATEHDIFVEAGLLMAKYRIDDAAIARYRSR